MDSPEDLSAKAHQLRSPVTGIQMMIHLLLEENVGPLTDMQRELVTNAKNDCERLTAEIDSLVGD